MRRILLTTAIVSLTGCASGGPTGPTPELTYDYAPAAQIQPPTNTTQSIPQSLVPPMPPGGIETHTMSGRPKPRYRSAAAKTAAMVKEARRNALDCTFEGVIMTCPFREGYPLEVTLDAPSMEGEPDANVTMFYLEPGEGNIEAIVSNQQWFTVEVTGGGVDTTSMRAKRDRARNVKSGGARLIVTAKAWKPGEHTTLAITSGARTYLYNLHVPNCTQKDPEMPVKCRVAYNPVVQHTYGSDAPAPVKMPVERGGPEVKDTRYSYEGPAEFLPGEWSAFNDGVNTYIIPPERLASRFVVYLPKGNAAQYWMDADGRYVIRGMPEEVRFPRGDKTMTVRRQQS